VTRRDTRLRGWRDAIAGTALCVGLLWAATPRVAAQPAPATESTIVEVTVVGGPGLNPNTAGRASPVVFRIFQLTSGGRFESAEYGVLFEQADDAFKQAVVAQEEFVLRPGEIQEHNQTVPSHVTMLGVAAAFRDIEHAHWRLTVPVKPGRRNFLLLHLNNDSIRVDPVDPGNS